MKHIQNRTPLYDALVHFRAQRPESYHVPGHKHGQVFANVGAGDFQTILSLDVTELPGLDDLHAPQDVIKEAEGLASSFFSSDHTFFLVGGSTAGNLAMVLAACVPGDVIIVQRNCHKSVMNAMELAGAKPVFLAPEYELETGRYSKVTVSAVRRALARYPEAKAVVLTYPDYFGRTYDLKTIIDEVHQSEIPVLVDEAHGVHFHLGAPFPAPALKLGADAVVQSAHKMAPAMTMASYLHIQSDYVDKQQVASYLRMVQSSSPSYPLLVSLDLARYYLANMSESERENWQEGMHNVRICWKNSPYWDVLPLSKHDDPMKLTLSAASGVTGFQIANALEAEGLYPEMATQDQVLLILGLELDAENSHLEEIIGNVNHQLKNSPANATIKSRSIPFPHMQELDMAYAEMKQKKSTFQAWSKAIGCIAAQPVIPYPPGIPIVVKGERITHEHAAQVSALLGSGTNFQDAAIQEGIHVYT
ncbi:aminotransferase class I/II-fold pyridoxal phosphate-dependent enzyme [Thalassobacillus sp. CUG 92003]|uniref:aminotransferase class I/II-fold pyridoxal phosphate-dependent enzyme n=1 Tax=Thalassobacillus sp. CUG 92003 TaxID=2736641 RepID=UPI0015E7676C|nr:aminotransferase class I/II-fold pyridoxal phosphate-dependent enzyme [Thalassobacillus sp. CUG 92003]